jgi:hypothetical protein
VEEQIRLLSEASKQDYIPPIALASSYTVLGQKAFEWLEKTYEERAPGLIDLELDPDYDKTRRQPFPRPDTSHQSTAVVRDPLSRG